jgi:hypothetical protein
MNFINGILNFAGLSGLLAAAILFVLGYENTAMISLTVSLFSFAITVCLYLYIQEKAASSTAHP